MGLGLVYSFTTKKLLGPTLKILSTQEIERTNTKQQRGNQEISENRTGVWY